MPFACPQGAPRFAHLAVPLSACLESLVCPSVGTALVQNLEPAAGESAEQGQSLGFSTAQSPVPAHTHTCAWTPKSCSPLCETLVLLFSTVQVPFCAFSQIPGTTLLVSCSPVFMLECSVPAEHLCLELHNLLGLTQCPGTLWLQHRQAEFCRHLEGVKELHCCFSVSNFLLLNCLIHSESTYE